jgi:hypothetical protein
MRLVSIAAQSERNEMLDINKVGKFETLKIINDKALIEIFGINMTDAKLTRYEVLASYGETGSARRSAEQLGEMRGIKRLSELAE